MTPACAKCRSCRAPQLASAPAPLARELWLVSFGLRRSDTLTGVVPSARRRLAILRLSTPGAVAKQNREDVITAAAAAEAHAAAKAAAAEKEAADAAAAAEKEAADAAAAAEKEAAAAAAAAAAEAPAEEPAAEAEAPAAE